MDYQDSRFWEVHNERGESLGVYMYGDMIREFASVCAPVLSSSYNTLKSRGFTHTVIGNLHPLNEDSSNETIQAQKVKWRRKERKRKSKRARKNGFKLDSKVKFGMHNGKTVRQIIDNHPNYWRWMEDNKVLLKHPEVNQYTAELT